MTDPNLDHDPRFWLMVAVLLPFMVFGSIALCIEDWWKR